jgi:DNA-binding winged helix-turn-helix (wHTH) protein/tetratricopeptide (TPR) repeat protein
MLSGDLAGCRLAGHAMSSDHDAAPDRLAFGDFAVDLRSQELWRGLHRVPLQRKAFLVLRELLLRPGAVVTRADLVAVLWPEGYFVDAEHGVNTALRRVREALGDSAAHPQYVETLPRVGYRFLGTVRAVPRPGGPALPTAGRRTPPSASLPPPDRLADPVDAPGSAGAVEARPATGRRRAVAAAAALLVAALAAAIVSRTREGPMPPGQTPAMTDRIDELLARARYLRNVKRQAEAMQFVARAQAIAPHHPHVLGSLALGLLGEGRDDEAAAMARRAIALDDGAWEGHRALGTLALTGGNFTAAERHLRQALAAGPMDAKSHTRLARHLLQIGRLDEARAAILDARRIQPDDPDVQNIWMEYALRSGDYASAVREGEQWLAIWGAQIAGTPTPVVRDMLGLAYLGSGRYDDALAQFRAIDPDDRLRVALVYAHAGRRGEARALVDAGESRDTGDDDPGRHGALAMVYEALADADRALTHLDRQLAGGVYPGWLNCRLFDGVRGAPGYAAFAARLERDFFDESAARVRPGPRLSAMRSAALQYWPRPARVRRG